MESKTSTLLRTVKSETKKQAKGELSLPLAMRRIQMPTWSSFICTSPKTYFVENSGKQ
jgi:hypothetical protein